jgi:type VI secretion system secreted protein Hcp
MALNSFLQVTGQVQGEIQGSVTQAGRENQILVYGWSHEILSPRDAASGLPTGKRQHAPLTITKPVDKSTPKLLQALVTNEVLTAVLRAWQPSRTGKEFQYYTIELTNAAVSQVQSEMLNNQYPENMKHEIREHVSFTYQTITWTWMDGGITFQDTWGAAASRAR